MPKNPSTTASKSKSTNKTPTKSPRVADPDAPAGLTPTQAAVLQQLSEQAGMSTAEVAAAESIGHSTAQKALTVLEAADLARRETGVRNGALKSPDRWFITTTTSADPESDRETPQTTAHTDAQGNDTAVDDAADRVDAVEPVDSEPASHSSAAEPADLATTTTLMGPADQQSDTPQDFATVDPDKTDDADHVKGSEVAPDTADKTAAADANQPSASVANPADGSDTAPGPAVDSTEASPDTTGVTGTLAPEVEAAPTGKSGPRLGKGELRAMVEQYLRDHPEKAWTPGKIGKELGGRSAGAVNNAAGKLVEAGVARTFDDTPHRFQIIAAPAGKTTRKAAKTAPQPSA
ncbi:MAG: MarR family transcriptional regulator [Catenulispora sp.]|nr:MarR family transcriptional regulator [Catenulispora sp.]